MNEVLPQLNELLFSSVEGALMESVEVIDTGRPGRGPYARRAGGPGGLSRVRALVGEYPAPTCDFPDRLQLKAVLANCHELKVLAEHVRSFGMVAHLQGDQLPTWIEAATSTTELPSLRRFARHLRTRPRRRQAGLTLPWNSGLVEGHVNPIKMLKRRMFGRRATYPGGIGDPPNGRGGSGMTAAHRRVRLGVGLVAAGLSLAGCSGGGDAGSGRSTSTTVTAADPDGTPSTASPTPVVSPSDVYPTNADGCHPNAKWSTAKAVDWVDWGQIGQPALGPGEVRFGKSTPGFDGPLCAKVTVQVEYWRINYRPSSATSAADPLAREVNYDFAMKPLKRSELHIDGRAVHDVKPPKGFASTKASPCDGFLEAIYVGSPLKSRELPTKIDTGNSILGDTVTFSTKRVVDYHVFAPSGPRLCDDNGVPTASPAPSGYPSSGFGLSTPSHPEFQLTPKS